MRSSNVKKGISLMILVITIIIMLILSGTIIVTVVNNTPIDNAKEAAIRSDYKSIKDKYQEEYTNLIYEHLGRKDEVTEEELQSIIPEEYKDELIATKDGISYVGEDEEKKEIAKDVGFDIGYSKEGIVIEYLNLESDVDSVTVSVEIANEDTQIKEIEYYITADGINWTNETSSEKTYDFTGLEQNTKYQVKVVITDNNDEKTESKIYSIKTKMKDFEVAKLSLLTESGKEYTSGSWTNEDVYIEIIEVSGLETTYGAKGANEIAEGTKGASVIKNEGITNITVTSTAGEITKTREYVVKIDKQAATINSVEVDKTNLTKENVTITGKAADTTSGIIAYQFSTNDNITESSNGWNEITNATSEITQNYTVETNGTYYFYVKDEAGNVTKKEIVIDNIDKTLPSTTAPTLSSNTNSITVQIKQTDESGIEKIEVAIKKSDDTTWGEWIEIDGDSYIFENLNMNTSYEVKTRATDKAGNTSESEVAKIITENLDKPLITAPTDITNKGVTVTITYPSMEGVTREYSTDGNTWVPVTGTTQEVTVSENNTTVYARILDSTGQTSEVATYTVTCIDKVAPTLESIAVTDPVAGTYAAGQEVTIVATYSENITGTAPVLKVKFGESTEREITTGTISNNTITYKYTIVGSDYGKLATIDYIGSITDSVGNELSVTNIALTGNEINAYTESKIQAVSADTTEAYYASEYRESISKVKFASSINVPEGAAFWDVSDAGNGSVMAYVEDDGNGGYVLTIAGNDKIIANTDSSYLFYKFTALKEIENISLFDTSNVTYMNSMFVYCSNLTNLDLSSFNTGNVTSMQSMFISCSNLESVNVTSFETGNVKNMENMFQECSSLTSLDVSNWNTSNVTDSSFMFYNCPKLTNLNVSNFDTSKVTDMQYMFSGCSNLASIDVSKWNTSNVTNMAYMFAGCGSVETLNVSGFDTSKNTNLKHMFEGCTKLKEIDVDEFDTSNVIEMHQMFDNCRSLISLDLSNFNTSNVTSMQSMFLGCESLTSLDLSSFDLSSVTKMNYMFSNCNNLSTEIMIDNPNITTYENMFYHAANVAPAEIIVDYTDETSELVDAMIATKVDVNSNVHKKDKIAPNTEAPTLTVSSYTVTATFNQTDNVAINNATRAYAIKKTSDTAWGEWITSDTDTYTFGGLEINTSYDVKTKASDTSGNTAQSEIAQITTKNLVKPTITAPTDITNSSVEVTITFPEVEGYTKEYSYDSVSWTQVTDTSITLEVTENNTTVYARVTDDADNVSQTASYTVTCIDKEAPILESIAVTDPVAGTYSAGQEVTIVATYSENITGTAPVLKVKFGEGAEREITTGTISNNTITYKYTIVGSDYGKLATTGYIGSVTDSIGNELTVSNIALTGNEISAYTESVIQAFSATSTDAFHASAYKSKITKAKFASSINVPEGAESWDVSEAGNGSVMAYVEDDSNGGYVLTIAGNGKVYANEDSSYMFYNFTALTDIENLTLFDTSNATTTRHMFSGCSSLTSLDVTNFNMSNNKNMSYMFNGCSTLTIIDVSKFDTSKVTAMHSMFKNCNNLKSLNASNFDTSNVISMYEMFNGCSKLTSLDVSNFNTSNVTDMEGMFKDCSSLTSLDVSGFNTSKVTNMYAMFGACSGLTSIDVSNFNTSNVKNMISMFNSCTNLTSLDVSGFDTRNVTNMQSMFNGCSKVTSLNVSNFDTTNVTNMSYMFGDCSSLTSLDVSGFNTSKVTDMSGMFQTCSSLTSLDVSNFDTSSATEIRTMFYNCSKLTSLDLNNFDISGVTDMSYMFTYCYNLSTEIMIDNPNITTYDNMFYHAATVSPAEIIVDYTDGTSELVDLMIATKVDVNSNVHKKDKIAPKMQAPTLTVSSYTVTATFNQTDDVAINNATKAYAIKKTSDTTWGEWITSDTDTYTFGGLEINTSYDVKTKASDTSGNSAQSEVAQITTKNLVKPTITAPTDITNSSVEVTINYPEVEGFTKEYSYDSVSWTQVQDTSITLEVTENNTTVYARVTDDVDNVSQTASYTVTCIDKEAPTLESIAVTSPVAGTYTVGDEVTIVATYSENITGTAPVLKVKFGESDEREIKAGTISNNTTTYKYTITGSDYGKLASTDYIGSITDIAGNELPVSNIALTGYEINGYTESKIQAVAQNTTEEYYASEYKSKITSVKFASSINIPEDAIYWDVSEAGNGSVMAYVEDDGNGGYVLTIAGNGKVYANEDSSHVFYNFTALTYIENIELFDTSNATTFRRLFAKCSKLTKLDLSNFNTSKVTKTEYMFDGCSGLTSLDVSSFDTSKVINMYNMFYSCSSLTELDVSKFDTSSLARTDYMFYNCSKLKSLDVSNFTSKISNMAGMFYGCSGLTSLDVSKFDTSNTAYMHYMFYNCSGLTSLDVSNWDTSKVTGMYRMFYGCSGLTNLDVSNFNTSKVTDMFGMFDKCSKLTSIDVSNFDTSKVTNMLNMFNKCSGLTSLDVSNFDTINVEKMSYMFSECSSLTKLDVSGFNTSKVTDMDYMFFQCNALTSLDVSGFNTSNVTNMSYMFDGCDNVTTLDVSGFDTTNVTDMSNMFSGCDKLTTLDVSGFDTTNVTTMAYMFYNCSGLTSLDVANFDTSKNQNLKHMFDGCSGLTSLDVSNFDTKNTIEMHFMFSECRSLVELDLSNFNTSNVTSMQYMFSACSNLITTISILGNNVTSYENMFNYAAIYSPAEIIVNYTAETSDLVDNMIATKSSNSNVVKGVEVTVPATASVLSLFDNEVEYTAPETANVTTTINKDTSGTVTGVYVVAEDENGISSLVITDSFGVEIENISLNGKTTYSNLFEITASGTYMVEVINTLGESKTVTFEI